MFACYSLTRESCFSARTMVASTPRRWPRSPLTSRTRATGCQNRSPSSSSAATAWPCKDADVSSVPDVGFLCPQRRRVVVLTLPVFLVLAREHLRSIRVPEVRLPRAMAPAEPPASLATTETTHPAGAKSKKPHLWRTGPVICGPVFQRVGRWVSHWPHGPRRPLQAAWFAPGLAWRSRNRGWPGGLAVRRP